MKNERFVFIGMMTLKKNVKTRPILILPNTKFKFIKSEFKCIADAKFISEFVNSEACCGEDKGVEAYWGMEVL